jgi:uncharacterized membrane protein YbhN (UPF0104 family)
MRLSIRIAGLLGLSILFLRSAELLPQTIETIGGLSWSGYGSGLVCYAAALLANAIRMRILVAATGHSIPASGLLSDIVKSTGLNALLAMGTGEVYRVAQLRRRGLGLVEAGAIVLADRSSGILVIAGAGLVGAAAFGVESVGSHFTLVSAASLAGTAILAMLIGGRIAARRWAPTVLPFFTDLRTLVGVVAASLAILTCWIGSVAAYAWSLGLDVELAVIAFAAPLVSIATLLPVSIGGIGIREASYALLLAPYGVTTSQAVALGLLQYSGFLICTLIAGLLFVFERPAPDVDTARA